MSGMTIHVERHRKKHPEGNLIYPILIDLLGFKDQVEMLNVTHKKEFVEKIHQENLRDKKPTDITEAILEHLADDKLYNKIDSPLYLHLISENYYLYSGDLLRPYVWFLPEKVKKKIIWEFADTLMDCAFDIYNLNNNPRLKNDLEKSMKQLNVDYVSNELSRIYKRPASYYKQFLEDFKEDFPNNISSIKGQIEMLNKYHLNWDLSIKTPARRQIAKMFSKNISLLETLYQNVSKRYSSDMMKTMIDYEER